MKSTGVINGSLTQRKIDKKAIDSLYGQGHLYAHFGDYVRATHGYNVFKVPFNAEFTCPNWDGRLSSTGCVFCPAQARQFTYESFRPVMGKSLKSQLKNQISYYKKKGAGEKAIVYIAFATNTYLPVPELKKVFDSALDHPDAIGLSIGTRPDCLPDEVLDLLGDYVKKGYEVWIEVGQQSFHFHTEEATNRQHGVAETIRVVKECRKRGILTLAFLIMGLPYETPSEMIETARITSSLGFDAVKLYPMLVMKDTKILKQYQKGSYRPISQKEYVTIAADFLEHLDPHILVQRLSKDCGLDGKVVPEWNTHRFIIGPRVEKLMMLRGTKQGSKHKLTLRADELVPFGKGKKRKKELIPLN
ncbi:MAG: TIGR01212 family radical SAM protein [Candidatus Altiarchaeota archaeon]